MSGKVDSTVESYRYDAKSTIKSDRSSNEFKPNKVAEVTTYTICDSNSAASPIKILVSATAVISNRSEGTCP